MLSTDLKAARAMIEKPGTWCTGTQDNGQGAHCAFGAIAEVKKCRGRCDLALATVLERRFRAGSLPPLTKLCSDLPAGEMTWEQLYASWFGSLHAVAAFNNSTDQQSVLALFDEAIADAEVAEARERTALPVQAIMDRALAGAKAAAPMIEVADAPA